MLLDEVSKQSESFTLEKSLSKIDNSSPVHESRIISSKKFNSKSSEFLSFMTQCEINFLIYPKTYAKDESKILFIIINLENLILH